MCQSCQVLKSLQYFLPRIMYRPFLLVLVGDAFTILPCALSLSLHLLLCNLPSYFESTNNNHQIPIQQNFKFSALFSAGWFKTNTRSWSKFQTFLLLWRSLLFFVVKVCALSCFFRDIPFFVVAVFAFCFLFQRFFVFCFFIGEIPAFWLLLRLW